MDDRGFDALTRALGGASTRRGALAALAGLVAGLGLAGREAEARGKRGKGKGPERAKRKTCQGGCGAGQTCRQGTCVCEDGGAPCGDACCAAGQQCEKEACVTPPRRCIDAGAPCSGLHRRCCDGRACASGQGGQHDVACYVPAGGACRTSRDCVYDSTCQEGACVANHRPDPVDGDGGDTGGDGNGNVRCSPEQTACGNACVDIRTDSGNCGACGNACASPETCIDGACFLDACGGGTCNFGYAHTASFGTLRNPAVDPPLGQNDPYLSQPGGVAVDSLGTTAWVSDTENHRIVVLTKVGGDWTHTASFGVLQSGLDNLSQNDGTFAVPRGISVNADGTKLWVADTYHGRVAEWTKVAGVWTHTASFGTAGDGNLGQSDRKLKFPNGVFVDAAGTTAWVADTYHDRIAIWTRSGAGWDHTSSFTTGGSPTGIFVDAAGTTAWVAGWDGGGQVWTRTGTGWTATAYFGVDGSPPLTPTDGKIRNGTGVVANAAGTVAWVSDAGLGRVTIWTKGGSGWTHSASFGLPVTGALGQQDGQMNGPRGLFVDRTGTTVWVADSLNDRITVWTV